MESVGCRLKITNQESIMTIRRIVSALFLSAGVGAAILSAQAGPMSWLTGGERIQGSGKIIKQNREVSHFNALSVGVSGDVESAWAAPKA
jgi:hypothetical protein